MVKRAIIRLLLPPPGTVQYKYGLQEVNMKSHRISVFLIVLTLLMTVLASCDDNTVTTAGVSTYEDLVSALAGTDDVVTLGADIKVEDTLVVTRAVTLDMNGKTLSNSTEIWNESAGKWSIISVRENGNLTITGNGEIDALENDCFGIDVTDGGKLVIENGEIIGNVSAVYVLEGSAEIKGGTYSIKQLDAKKDYAFTLNAFDENYNNKTAIITVIGGSFVNFDPAANAAESSDNTTNFVAGGYKTTTAEEGGKTIYTVVTNE